MTRDAKAQVDAALEQMQARADTITAKLKQLAELESIAAAALHDIREALEAGLVLVESNLEYAKGLAGMAKRRRTAFAPQGRPVN